MLSIAWLLVSVLASSTLTSGYIIPESELRLAARANPVTKPNLPAPSAGVASGNTLRDPALFNRFKKYSLYVEASYDEVNYQIPTSPRPMQPSTLQATVEWTIKDTPRTGTTAFIAKNVADKEIVLVIRGSISVSNWIADFEFSKEPVKFCPGCKIHAGFATGWQDMKPSVMPMLWKLAASSPGYKIVVVGHSYGGAVATVAGFDLQSDERIRKSRTEVQLFAYASPRVGDNSLARWMTSVVSKGFKAYRIVSSLDPVPRIPMISQGFAHFQPQYLITDNAANPSMADIKITPTDREFLTTFTISAHTTYFREGIDHLGGTLLHRLSSCIPTLQNLFKTATITRRALLRARSLKLRRDIIHPIISDGGFAWIQ